MIDALHGIDDSDELFFGHDAFKIQWLSCRDAH
jgi:hypothetical protein